MGGPSDIPLSQCGIEPRKVSQFPRHSGRRPTDEASQFYNLRIADVNSAKRNLAVQVEGNYEFVACPVAAGHIMLEGMPRKDNTFTPSSSREGV
jgi:hypothetical protein